jgi:hypothetical protein
LASTSPLHFSVARRDAWNNHSTLKKTITGLLRSNSGNQFNKNISSVFTKTSNL